MGAEGSSRKELQRQRRAKLHNCAAVDRSSHESVKDVLLEEIVVAVAHENNGAFASCVECEQLVQDAWGFSFSPWEYKAAIDRLVEAGRLFRTSGSVELAPSAAKDVADRCRTGVALESTALYTWEVLVDGLYPNLGGDQKERLREELVACLRDLITDRGTEAAVLLYPEEENFRNRFEEIVALSVSPRDDIEPTYNLVRLHALKALFDYMIPVQRQWLQSMLCRAYLLNTLAVDPATFDHVKRITRGQRLYLDTNVLFDLLELRGRGRSAKIKVMLKRAALQGYEICITPWTRSEFKRTIRAARDYARKGGVSRRNAQDDDRIDSTYLVIRDAYRSRRKDKWNGLGLTHFIEELENLEYQLMLHDVEVKGEGCKAIDDEVDRIDSDVTHFEKFLGGESARSKATKIHDVKTRRLIERRRGDVTCRFSNAESLLLTLDQSLCAYARRLDPDGTPFAVHVDAWDERLRELAPRVEDFNNTLTLLFEAPALHIPHIVTNEQVVRILNRLPEHDQLSSEANIRFLLDRPPVVEGEPDLTDYDRTEDERSEREIALEAQLTASRNETVLLRSALDERSAEATASRVETALLRSRLRELGTDSKALESEVVELKSELDLKSRREQYLESELEAARNIANAPLICEGGPRNWLDLIRGSLARYLFVIAAFLALNFVASVASQDAGWWAVPGAVVLTFGLGMGLVRKFSPLWIAVGVVSGALEIFTVILRPPW